MGSCQPPGKEFFRARVLIKGDKHHRRLILVVYFLERGIIESPTANSAAIPLGANDKHVRLY